MWARWLDFYDAHRTWILILSSAAIVLTLGLSGAAFCVGSPWYYAEKRGNPHVPQRPGRYAGGFFPEKQVEAHTCGLHSVRSLYAAYGLDPDAARLRFRLGTDKPATNFDPETLGTLHPDITRVLEQDGFTTRTRIFTPDADGVEELRSHLAAEKPAMALIRVTGLHWIVLTRLDGDNVEICDSLREGLPIEPFESFVRERVKSVILVEPAAR